MKTIFFIVLIIWCIIYTLLYIYLYLTEDRPYKTNFKGKYYEEIPALLNPAELSMLMYKKIIPEVFTATIIFLINKEKILVKKEDNDYVMYNNREYRYKLSDGQQCVIDILFNLISRDDRVSLTQIYNYTKKKGHSTIFLNSFSLFKKVIIKEATTKKFFETKLNYSKVQFVKCTGYILFVINIVLKINSLLGFFIIIPTYFISYYFYKIYKRTYDYNELYHQWLGFKNYLIDIKKFKYPKENIRKYFMYGIVLKVNTLEKDILNRSDGFMTKLYSSINKCIFKSYFLGERGPFRSR